MSDTAGSGPTVDESLLEGVEPDDREVERCLIGTYPGAVSAELARAWRDHAAGLVERTPATCPAGVDVPDWVDVRRSALRDVEAADGWLARAPGGAGNQQLFERLVSMGWQGELGDQPAYTAMEQAARAIIQCRQLGAAAG